MDGGLYAEGVADDGFSLSENVSTRY